MSVVAKLAGEIEQFKTENGVAPSAISCSKETMQAMFENLDVEGEIVEHEPNRDGIPMYVDRKSTRSARRTFGNPGEFTLLNDQAARAWGVPGRPGCFGTYWA